MSKTPFLFFAPWIVIIIGVISFVVVLFSLRSRRSSPNFPGMLLGAIVTMIIGVGSLLANYGYHWTSAFLFLIASVCGLMSIFLLLCTRQPS
jgi:hypothetical protein